MQNLYDSYKQKVTSGLIAADVEQDKAARALQRLRDDLVAKRGLFQKKKRTKEIKTLKILMKLAKKPSD